MNGKPTVSQLRRFVGNPEAYAVQHEDGSWSPRRQRLTDEVLERHLAQRETAGTYINVKDHAHLLVFDIDTGDFQAARGILLELLELGVPLASLALEDSGRKGFHVWLLLQDEAQARDLRRIGRFVLAAQGLPEGTEVFPKQDEVKDLGNLVKLPWGKHQVTGNPNPLLGGSYFGESLPLMPRPMPATVLENILGKLPVEVNASRNISETRFPCLEAIQEEGCQEGGRNTQLFHLAAMLRRAGVSEPNVETIVDRANGLGDPLDPSEVSTLLDSSRVGGPLCHQLPEERKCGDLCILARTSGLYTRPGQLRHAGVGENVVVTVSEKKGRVVHFEHDDCGILKAVLRGY